MQIGIKIMPDINEPKIEDKLNALAKIISNHVFPGLCFTLIVSEFDK